MKAYFWDFFGPHAEETAKHFRKHLDGFLSEHACSSCKTALLSLTEGHMAVECEAPREHQELIERTLRPKRSEPRA